MKHLEIQSLVHFLSQISPIPAHPSATLLSNLLIYRYDKYKANFSSNSNNLTPISSYECKVSAQEETQWRSSLHWFFLTFENVKQHLPLVAARSCALVKTINRDHLFFSAEPNAWEHEAVWLHLQQQMVHWDLHRAFPQQEGSLWREDYSQPAHHLLPRVHRYTNVCLHPRAALSSRRVLSNHNIRKLNLSS